MTVLAQADELYRQCQLAAYNSRLDPHTLHILEFQHLKGRISDAEIALYLRVRNNILRLWTRNPLLSVSRDEVLEAINEKRLHSLAIFAHEWLARHGYINFGCLEIPGMLLASTTNPGKRKTVVIIGAGVSGLGCARQLQGLFTQFSDRWTKDRREKPPRIILLEARHRIGGRIYSHPLRTQVNHNLPHGLANTAEMGAQIITGFDHGNPLDALVRGQLALEYYPLKDNLILYDHDGRIIDGERDARIQTLFNEILESASVHGWRSLARLSASGNRMLNELGVNLLKQGNAPDPAVLIDKTGPIKTEPTLGAFMDHFVTQYMRTSPLSQQDLRLLHWHYANLEYANAVNVDQLSLGGWDQDQGNEFEGRHSEIVGGYGQVPRALWQRPTALDVRFKKYAKRISYTPNTTCGKTHATIECDDGDILNADIVIATLPLGVLQEGKVVFEPSLPSWKTGAINRLGFGVLNKVILVFDHIFWESHRDMFGLLNLASTPESLATKDYALNRGKFYLFWNCIQTSGRPMLVALMAGEAARHAERISDQDLVDDVTGRLATMFNLRTSPRPIEAIVTRWQKDPFARGSYSYMGPAAQPGDYESMALPVGNLFFAGEATCGTHPATVHGAYLSGLRAAAEVVEALIGPIPAPSMKVT